jgi:hypothetical protein
MGGELHKTGRRKGAPVNLFTVVASLAFPSLEADVIILIKV